MISTTLSLVAQLLLSTPLRTESNAKTVEFAGSAAAPPHAEAVHLPWHLSLQGGQRRGPEGKEQFAMVHLATHWAGPSRRVGGTASHPLEPWGRDASLPEAPPVTPSPALPRRATSDSFAPPKSPLAPQTEAKTPLPRTPSMWLTAARAAQVVGEALAVHRATTTEHALARMARRARWTAALPDVRLRGGTSADESLRFNPTVDDPARFTQAGARDLWFDAQLTWHLRGALFAPEEVAIERLRRQREQDKAHLVDQVLRALNTWQKSTNALQQPLLLREDRLRLQLSALQAAIRLDALTDNWFSRHAPGSGSEATE